MTPILNIPINSNYVLKRGDTIQEIPFTFADTDAIDLVGATIRMQLYLGKRRVWSIDSTDGITIIDSKNFTIDQVAYQDNTLPSGTLKGDLEITDSNGKRLTSVDIIYTITEDYTK